MTWIPTSSPHQPASVGRACCSDRGRQRPRNEDACALPSPGADETAYGTLLALADGTGGLPGGAEASREAVDTLQALYYAASGPGDPAARLRRAVEGVNAVNRLAQRPPGQENGRVTTLMAAVVYAGEVWVANVGDSRAYLIQAEGRQVQQLTEDHSGHVRDVKAGLAREADEASRQAGVITRAIGLHDRCQVDTYHYTWQPGDRLLLCSDGLAGLRAEEVSAEVFDRPVQAAARELVRRAVEADGSDNCTALVAAWIADQSAPTDQAAPTNQAALTDRAAPTDQAAPENQAQADRNATLPSRPQLARSRSRNPAAHPDSPAPRPVRKPGRPGVSPGLLWIGLLLGWLSAAILFILLLESSGTINLFP